MPSDTLLVLTGMGIPPYSARGLTQTLDPIGASQHLERDVNGALVDLANPAMRKYQSKVTCSDANAPAIGGIWPGMVLTVDCVRELSYPTALPVRQERTEVPGSVRIEGDFTYYRPRLTMKVTNFTSSGEEWAANATWSLDMEEE